MSGFAQLLEDLPRAVELHRGRLRIAEGTAGETDQDLDACGLIRGVQLAPGRPGGSRFRTREHVGIGHELGTELA